MTSERVSAEDVCEKLWKTTPDDTTKLRKLQQSDCLWTKTGSDSPVADLRAAIRELPELEDTSRAITALDIMGLIHLRTLPDGSVALPPECRVRLAEALTTVNDALLRHELVPPEDLACSGPAVSAFKPTCWEFDATGAVPVIPALQECRLDVQDTSSLEGAAAVVRLAALVHDALDGYFAPLLSDYHAQASELRGRWWAYFHETRAQYPWELLVNAAAFSHKIERTKGQFHSPPTGQWILAHPEASVEYVKDAPDGEQFKPALTVELIGFNRWKWKGQTTARAIGVAAVANYSDVASIPDWRFGAVIHVAHKYSFGATRADGETGYFVSADLATLFFDKQKKAKEFLGRLKKK